MFRPSSKPNYVLLMNSECGLEFLDADLTKSSILRRKKLARKVDKRKTEKAFLPLPELQERTRRNALKRTGYADPPSAADVVIQVSDVRPDEPPRKVPKVKQNLNMSHFKSKSGDTYEVKTPSMSTLHKK